MSLEKKYLWYLLVGIEIAFDWVPRKRIWKLKLISALDNERKLVRVKNYTKTTIMEIQKHEIRKLSHQTRFKTRKSISPLLFIKFIRIGCCLIYDKSSTVFSSLLLTHFEIFFFQILLFLVNLLNMEFKKWKYLLSIFH